MKNNSPVLETVSPGIVETSSEFNVTKHVKRYIKRKKAEMRRNARKRATMNKREKASVEAPKLYTVLVQYHQLNYTAIKAELEAIKMKPSVIDNTRFWMEDVNAESLEKLKEAMRKCHYETKQGKQYRVRLAAYKAVPHANKEKEKKKPTNNKPDVAKAARNARKEAKIKKAANCGRHLLGRNAKKVSHKPGVLDTSSIAKKLSDRVKKAIKASERAERDRAAQAKSRANKGIPQPKKGKQLEIAA